MMDDRNSCRYEGGLASCRSRPSDNVQSIYIRHFWAADCLDTSNPKPRWPWKKQARVGVF